MVDRSNVSGGLGMVAVAVLSTGVILASYYHLHRRLESKNIEQRRHSRTKRKKKVRFADVVATDLSTDGDGCATAAASGGKLVRPALRKPAYSSTRFAC